MDHDLTNPEEDPTVLEVLRRYFNKDEEANDGFDSETIGEQKRAYNRLVPFALICFLTGQFLIEYLRETLAEIGIVLLLAGFALSAFAFLSEKKSATFERTVTTDEDRQNIVSMRLVWLLAAFVTAIIASLMYRQGSLSFLSGLLWITSIVSIVVAFFQPKAILKPNFKSIFVELTSKPKKLIAYLLLIVIVLVFQFGRLEQVPPEIISSQVEAFYTVDGVINGEAALWFPRNVVSEPISYYWASLVNLFRANLLNFTGLKFAFALAGLVAVFYMYKLGRRLFDEKTGYISALMLGVGFWPILQQRAVLGFGLVLPIMLPAVYYLFKSLQADDLNSLLFASVLTGLGLLTNKIFFVVVFANLLITLVYFSRNGSNKPKISLAMRIGIGLITAIVVVLPLIFVVAANPTAWFSPIISQLSFANNPTYNSPITTFLKNLVAALGLVNWSNRNGWVDGISNRAALDWISGALFLFGLSVMIFRDIFNDRKQVISILVLFFLMLLPSALSLAQPMENPSLSRALGAAVTVFLIAGRGFAFAIDRIWASQTESHWVKQAGFVVIFSLLIIIRNFGLINTAYVTNYEAFAWNASDMAEVIRNYDTGQARNSQAYIVGFPHWVDARSVAISLNRSYTNLSILPQELSSTVDLQTAKIFLLHITDTESLGQLQSLYPGGVATTYQSIQPEKNFIIYIASQ